jgi:hypothetical protein
MDLLVPWGLVAVRLWAILRAQILWRSAVGPAWSLAAVVLAFAIAGTVTGPAEWQPAVDWRVAALAEFALGTTIGLLVSLPGYALLGGMSAVALLVRTQPSAFVGLALVFVLALGMALELHRPLLLAAAGSFDVFALGNPRAWSAALEADGVAWLAEGAHTFALLSIVFATPALLFAAVCELAVRLATQPLEELEGLAPWVRSAAALVALGCSWVAYAHTWAERAWTAQ